MFTALCIDLEECGEYGAASDHARLALEVNPDDAWPPILIATK